MPLQINGKTFTGNKLEGCRGCGEVFNTTRAGDRHRVVIYKYTIISLNGKTIRVNEDQDVLPENAKVHSRNNEMRRCLTPDEMRNAGMRQEANGSWNNGGVWGGWRAPTD